MTARSWLPARQTSACWRASAAAVVGIGAVADDVAQAPDLARAGLAATSASTASKAWRLPWMSETMATCMDLAAGLGRGAFFTNVERPRRVAVAVVAAFVVAEAAVLLLRPRDGVIAPVPVDPGSYFTPAELERARDYRHGQLALFAASTAIEAALLVWLVRRPPARAARALPPAGARGGGRRRGAVGGLRRRPAPGRRHQPPPLGRRRASRPRTGGRGWATSPSRRPSGRSSPASAPRPRWRSCAASRARWWVPGQRPGRRLRDGLHLPGPGRPRPDLQPLHGAARGPHARATCWRWPARRASTSARSTRSTPAGARRPPTPTSRGWGATKRVVLYDNLLKDFTRDEVRLVVAHELGHVHYRDVPRGLLYVALVAPARALRRGAAHATAGAGRAAARPGGAARRWRSRSRSSSSA